MVRFKMRHKLLLILIAFNLINNILAENSTNLTNISTISAEEHPIINVTMSSPEVKLEESNRKILTMDHFSSPTDLFYFLHNTTLNYSNPGWNYNVCHEKFVDSFDYEIYEYLIHTDYLYCYCYGDTNNCGGIPLNEDIEAFLAHQGSIYANNEKLTKEYFLEFPGKWFKEHLPFNIILSTSYVLVFIWGAVGNLLVIITVFGFLNRRNVTNIFISNMSISDLLVILFALPLQAVDKVRSVWYLGEWLCRAGVSVYFTSLFVSSFTMTAMAMERYLVICYPMKAQYVSTAKRARMIIGVIWIVAIGLSILPAEKTLTLKRCRLEQFIAFKYPGAVFPNPESFIIKSYVAVVGFLVPLIIMTFAYIRTGVTLYRSVKEAGALMGVSSTKDSDKKKKQETQKKLDDLQARIQVIKMLVTVLVIFVVAWLPNIIMELVFYSGKWQAFTDEEIANKREEISALLFSRQNLLSKAIAVTSLLTFMNSCINPLIYAFLSKAFMKGFVRCFGWLPCCKSLASKYRAEASTAVSSGFTRSTRGAVSSVSGSTEHAQNVTSGV